MIGRDSGTGPTGSGDRYVYMYFYKSGGGDTAHDLVASGVTVLLA